MPETLTRSVTILVIISFLGTIFTFGNNLALIVTSFIICAFASYEWIKFTSKSRLYLLPFLIVISAVYYIPFINIKYLSLVTLSIWLVLIILMFLSTDSLKYLIEKYSNVVGIFLLASFFAHLISFFSSTSMININSDVIDRKYYLLLLILLLSIIDIFSYFSGKIFGSFKIVPKISPNKTIEGYFGGYIFTMIMFITFSEVYKISWMTSDILYLTLLILLAFSGDLFMSVVKRTYKIKDTGTILPGHGGLLDRLDSYLPSTPLFFLWVMA